MRGRGELVVDPTGDALLRAAAVTRRPRLTGVNGRIARFADSQHTR